MKSAIAAIVMLVISFALGIAIGKAVGALLEVMGVNLV